MRSLWRLIAARWLGGQASEALTGATAVNDFLLRENTAEPPAFLVRRRSEVSRRTTMSTPDNKPRANAVEAKHDTEG
jgi:hypothetical protein